MKRTADQMTEQELEQYGIYTEMIRFYDGETMAHGQPKKVYFVDGKPSTVFKANARILRQDVTAKRAAGKIDDLGWPKYHDIECQCNLCTYDGNYHPHPSEY